MRVAVMQPCLYTYRAYFQLFAPVDMFLLFDCMQSPQRERVYHAPLPDGGWLTLPLAEGPRDMRNRGLTFAANVARTCVNGLELWPWLGHASNLDGALAAHSAPEKVHL